MEPPAAHLIILGRYLYDHDVGMSWSSIRIPNTSSKQLRKIGIVPGHFFQIEVKNPAFNRLAQLFAEPFRSYFFTPHRDCRHTESVTSMQLLVHPNSCIAAGFSYYFAIENTANGIQ